MPLSRRLIAGAYVAWALFVFTVTFLENGLSADNVTHLGIAAYLALSVLAIPFLRRLADRYPLHLVFVAACCTSAAVVETCYMISTPLHPSLIVDRGTGLGDALRNLGVDLAFTLPAYVLIFTVVWMLLRRIAYDAVDVAILFAAGQAFGDGGAFFSTQPHMLLFLPYIMLNYQAMTLVPFIALHDRFPPEPQRSAWIRVPAPMIVLPLVYFVAGASIILTGRALGVF